MYWDNLYNIWHFYILLELFFPVCSSSTNSQTCTSHGWTISHKVMEWYNKETGPWPTNSMLTNNYLFTLILPSSIFLFSPQSHQLPSESTSHVHIRDNLQWPTNLPCLYNVGANQSNQNKSIWSLGECSNATQTDPKVRIEGVSLALWGNCSTRCATVAPNHLGSAPNSSPLFRVLNFVGNVPTLLEICQEYG